MKIEKYAARPASCNLRQDLPESHVKERHDSEVFGVPALGEGFPNAPATAAANSNCGSCAVALVPLLLLWSQRLPQFDLVAVGIVDPREPAIVCILALGIDLDALFLQAFKQRIQVIHDVVHHKRLPGREVLGVFREHGPDGHMLLLGVVFLPPGHHDASAFIRESEMLAVPLTHLLLIRGLEEYSTDPQDSPSLARCCRSFLRGCRIRGGARLLLREAKGQQQY